MSCGDPNTPDNTPATGAAVTAPSAAGAATNFAGDTAMGIASDIAMGTASDIATGIASVRWVLHRLRRVLHRLRWVLHRLRWVLHRILGWLGGAITVLRGNARVLERRGGRDVVPKPAESRGVARQKCDEIRQALIVAGMVRGGSHLLILPNPTMKPHVPDHAPRVESRLRARVAPARSAFVSAARS